MKKAAFLIITIMVLSLSLALAIDKEQVDTWTALVSEKDLQVKMQKLEAYYDKYGAKEDRYSMYMYVYLAQTSYLLQKYEKTIQFGEKALVYKEIDASNKLPLYLYLANAYNLTKQDLDKAYGYAEQIVTLASSLRSANAGNSAMDINYTAPALRIQAQLLAAKGQEEPQKVVNALDKAIEAFKLDKSDKSANFVIHLSDHLSKNERIADAIRGLEAMIEVKANADYSKLLGVWYARLKDNPKAIENFKVSYAQKKNAQVAYNLGILLNQNQELDAAIEYLAEAHLLNDEKYSPEALKLLDHLVFFEKAKGQPQAEQETLYNEILAAARARLETPQT